MTVIPTPDGPEVVEPLEEAYPTNAFVFFSNIEKLPGESYELAPAHLLRRATLQEVEYIRIGLKMLGYGEAEAGTCEALWQRTDRDSQRKTYPLPEGEWKYHVLSLPGSNEVISRMQDAMVIAPVDIEVGFIFGITDMDGQMVPSVVSNRARLHRVISDWWHNVPFFVQPTVADLDQVKTIHQHMESYNYELINVRQLAEQMKRQRELPYDSPLGFLGYFAVLESLLTHAPKPTDPYDSITRQVKKKLTLLDNRWAQKIDYAPFAGASAEKVWGTMYGYRSTLIHGGKPDFKKEHHLLGDHRQALKLIRETVKTTIRHALVEPRLLLDLKEC